MPDQPLLDLADLCAALAVLGFGGAWILVLAQTCLGHTRRR